MADALAKRREARRRKLLMSSEDRMNRILQLNSQIKEESKPIEKESDISKEGVPDDVATEHTIPPKVSTNEPTVSQPNTLDYGTSISSTEDSKKSQTTEDFKKSPTTEDSKKSPSTEDSKKSPTTEDSKNSPTTDVKPSHGGDAQDRLDDVTQDNEEQQDTRTDLTRRTHTGRILSQDGSPSESLSSQAIQQDEMDQQLPTLTPDAQASTKADDMRKGNVVTGREVVFFCLAIVMRCILASDWLTDYTGQSIIVPFIALQLALAMLAPNNTKLDGNMMMKALSMALMLSQIPQQTISRLNHFMGIMAAIFTDLALYLFTFITVHCVFDVIGL